jgi:hypothetical protein
MQPRINKPSGPRDPQSIFLFRRCSDAPVHNTNVQQQLAFILAFLFR